MLVLLACAAGCTNLSGLDASSNYSCPAPPGVVCKPMSAVYRSPVGGSSADSVVPATTHDAKSRDAGPQLNGSTLPVTLPPTDDKFPLRSPPKVLRIWTAPYADTDGDLHEEHRMYLQVDSGHWMLEHHQARIQSAFTPLQAPGADNNAGVNDAAKSDKRPNVRTESLPGAQPASPTGSPDLFDSAPGSGALK